MTCKSAARATKHEFHVILGTISARIKYGANKLWTIEIKAKYDVNP